MDIAILADSGDKVVSLEGKKAFEKVFVSPWWLVKFYGQEIMVTADLKFFKGKEEGAWKVFFSDYTVHDAYLDMPITKSHKREMEIVNELINQTIKVEL